MAICYDRLFHLMIDKKISNAQLKEKAGFSANIITRLKRNEYDAHFTYYSKGYSGIYHKVS